LLGETTHGSKENEISIELRCCKWLSKLPGSWRYERTEESYATLKALATTGDLPDAQPVHVGLLRRCSMHWWPSELSLVLSVRQLDFMNSDEHEKCTNRESSMVGLLTDGR
jgi:hypothetical protein